MRAEPADYRFGAVEIRTQSRQVLLDNHEAVIGARAFDVLVALIERAGGLVTKDELLELVWPGLVVEENNLQVHVSALRRLLGPEAIATVPGHGYRFAADVTRIDAAPAHPPQRVARHNLPAQITSFVGREDDLARLRALLPGHRCVTLTGPGGIGKTRLALELAASVAEAYRDGAWLVDLVPISDGALAAGAIAAALGIRAEGDRSIVESLRRFVADREILVVLDNCEHLAGACALLAAEMTRAGPRVSVLATSRQPLQVTGEVAYAVSSLPMPGEREDSVVSVGAFAAARLFVERAAAAAPAFALTARNAPLVARICRDLDGIPLALELAASRVRVMPVDALAAHLGDRFRLLKSAGAAALPRQQTLRGAIDWSYDMLEAAERLVFQRLAVFAGGFTLDAAEAVTAGEGIAEPDVPVLLGQLVDKSLVVFDATNDRYRLLETMRQYAQERLSAAGERDRVRDRHLRYYAGLGAWARRELDGRGQASCRARLDAERENLLLAFEHARDREGGAALALGMLFDYFMWLTYGDIALWHGVAHDVLSRPDALAETAARSRALCVASFLDYMLGRYRQSCDVAQEAVRIARACNDGPALAEALYGLGLAAFALDRPDEARAHFEEGLTLMKDGEDPNLLASLHCGLGELDSGLGALERAEAAYLQAIAVNPDDPHGNAINFGNAARNAIALGAKAKALACMREIVALTDPRISIQVTQTFLWNMASLAALTGDAARAMRLYGAADAHQANTGLLGTFVDAPFHARSLAQAREALGEEASTAAFAEGRAWDADAAVDEAIEWLHTFPSTGLDLTP
ncbi:MAG: winged helix-turn-helix domain-containing protein [Burkholderiales bacterium]